MTETSARTFDVTPKYIMQLSSVVLSLVLTAAAVLALPNGAPICAIGDSNVRNLHLAAARNPKSGQIQEGFFEIFLDGVMLNRTTTGNNTFPFTIGVNHTISVASTKSTKFKGALVLLSQGGNNTKIGLLPQAPYKDAIGCEGVQWAGLSHDENSLKPDMNSTLRWDIVNDRFLFDVNIVTQNNVSGSVYYYSQYKLIAVQAKVDAPCGFLKRLLRRCGK